jgi:hypothetical protein
MRPTGGSAGNAGRQAPAAGRRQSIRAGRLAAAITVAAAALAALTTAATAPEAGPSQVGEQLRASFARAEILFRSGEPELALEPLSRVIAALEPGAEADRLDDEGRALLIRSLAYRADVHIQRGEAAAADADLGRLLELYPRARVEGFRLSEDLLRRFERVRARLVGTLVFSVTPLDARVIVDGRQLPEGTTTYDVLAGPHMVEAVLPGHTRRVEQVEARADRGTEVSMTLERVSSVVKLLTRPAGATVVVDGNIVGETSGVAPRDWTPSGEAARFPRQEFSGEMAIEGLMPGTHDIEVFLDGYRSFSGPLVIPDLGDYHVGGIVLTPNLGSVLLRDLTPAAEVWVDGRRAQPEPPAVGAGGELAGSAYRLSLPPGEYRITVSQEDAGVFEELVTVADRANVALTVRLRPGLTFLGVVGEDRLGAESLEAALSTSFDQLGYWAFLDRSEEAARVVERAGITADRLRATAAGEAELDWERIQAGVSRDLPGSVFALAVLDRDNMAAEADLWVWPSAPGPAIAERVRVSLADRRQLEAVTRRLSEEIRFEKPWMGLQLIDSAAAAGPVVAHLVPGSPAATAGIRVGEQLLTIAGNSAGTAANTANWLSTFSPGAAVVLALRGPEGAERSVEVRLAASPVVVSPADPSLLYSTVWGMAGAAVGRLDANVASWVAEANQAAVLIHARRWSDAARLLREIQAPVGPGVGQGLIDYWLGVALAGSGDVDGARAAFERVLAEPEARYLDNDGPYLAPFARARLAALAGRGSGGGGRFAPGGQLRRVLLWDRVYSDSSGGDVAPGGSRFPSGR